MRLPLGVEPAQRQLQSVVRNLFDERIAHVIHANPVRPHNAIKLHHKRYHGQHNEHPQPGAHPGSAAQKFLQKRDHHGQRDTLQHRRHAKNGDKLAQVFIVNNGS